VVALGEQVERHEARRRDLGEQRHARGGGVDALLQRLEVRPAPVALDDDLAVQHEPAARQRELREVAGERPAAAGLDQDAVPVDEHDGPEAVELRLVRPVLADGERRGGPGELRRKRRRERQHAPRVQASLPERAGLR
jgi:hypothetical protein